MSTAIKSDRRQFLRTAGMTLAASQLGSSRVRAASFFSGGSLPSLDGATTWLNSPPLTKESLRGKVVQVPDASHGADIDAQGNGTVTEPRMYQLIRQAKPIVDRRFEIEFLDPGLKAFSFTFG